MGGRTSPAVCSVYQARLHTPCHPDNGFLSCSPRFIFEWARHVNAVERWGLAGSSYKAELIGNPLHGLRGGARLVWI